MLDQAFAHCPIFPTAASRRSLGRVSVPVWLIILSDQLPIIALVGHYPTNKLIGRRLLHRRLAPLTLRCHAVLAAVSRCYPPPMDRYLRVTHPSATEGLPPPCDLHVLSMPPAFALSQDQTLRFIKPNLAETKPSPTNRTQISQTSIPWPTRTTELSKRLSTHIERHINKHPKPSPRNQDRNPRNLNQTDTNPRASI